MPNHVQSRTASDERPRPPKHVIIVGGGVVGLAVACELRQRGPDVTIVERFTIGSGASRANAGEICPDLALPLPSAATIRAGLQSLVGRSGSLQLRAHFSPTILGFLGHFVASARSANYKRSVCALHSLARLTRPVLRDLLDRGLDVPMNEADYMAVFKSRASAAALLGEIQRHWAGDGQPPSRMLEHDELSAIEPCLSPMARAGWLVAGQLAVDPFELTTALARLAVNDGVVIVEGAGVTVIEETGESVRVRTSSGVVTGDAVVVAAGIWSPTVLRALGVRLPIVPGKGYSFAVELRDAPSHVIMLKDARVAILPLGEATRMSGALDLDIHSDQFDARRVEAVVAAAGPYFHDVDWRCRRDEWMGPRPMTPTGLPFIGRLPRHSRVFVAAGHNMLGVTLAPATGRVLAELLCGGRASIDLAPFAPGSGG